MLKFISKLLFFLYVFLQQKKKNNNNPRMSRNAARHLALPPNTIISIQLWPNGPVAKRQATLDSAAIRN